MNENKFIEQVISQLSKDFIFDRHVMGTHPSGRRLQIDFVIKPIDNSGWKNKNARFGLEFKDMPNLEINADTKDFTKWIAQCVDYTYTHWDSYGYIYVLTCPGITDAAHVKAIDGAWMFLRVMGALGIGELKLTKNYGWAITLHEQHRMWSQKNGVESGKHWNLERKFGSR